jgi:putative restriction endonuclease
VCSVQNGVLLTKEFHTLFDLGYVGITPELRVRVSPRLRDTWSNGKRYYAFDEHPLQQVPARPDLRPSPEALRWHLERRFRA